MQRLFSWKSWTFLPTRDPESFTSDLIYDAKREIFVVDR